MICFRRIVTQWGRWIASGLVVTLLFSQVALAMYACPKLDSDTHVASMQMAGMAMEDAASMSGMPDCHAMPGTMDGEAPQLCRAHCSGDGKPVPSLQGLDVQTLAAQAVWFAYMLPAVIEAHAAAGQHVAYVPPDHRAGFPPIYLTLQVLRN
ncbi:hypothetical protein [Ottowia sp. VDI28]|uniref:hypothetical protein n=1 Tax=Ottowia sp. VDI28 TaxID=3133968 RepID=UPI003C2CDBA9